LSSDPGGESPGIGRAGGFGMKEGPEVAVAESRSGELPVGDGLEQGDVVGVADAHGTDATTAVVGMPRDLVEEITKRAWTSGRAPRGVESSTLASASR
jgi:hypothetical protein